MRAKRAIAEQTLRRTGVKRVGARRQEHDESRPQSRLLVISPLIYIRY